MGEKFRAFLGKAASFTNQPLPNKKFPIDKDGSLIPRIPLKAKHESISIEKGMTEGLKMLRKEHFLLIIISNQPGIALGHYKEGEMVQVQNKILQLLKPHHISINGFYYCPHHPQGTVKDYSVNCFCRKPQPGLILRAAKDFNIDLGKSWMIGDTLEVMEAGKRAGCQTMLVNNGHETKWDMNDYSMPDQEVNNFRDAALLIINGMDQISINRNKEQKRVTI
jgi:D,D-heptose 1,7-bisphosphate phosphatase